jgi:hypothetical protein
MQGYAGSVSMNRYDQGQNCGVNLQSASVNERAQLNKTLTAIAKMMEKFVTLNTAFS